MCCCSPAVFARLESFYGVMGMDTGNKKVTQETVCQLSFVHLLTMKIILYIFALAVNSNFSIQRNLHVFLRQNHSFAGFLHLWRLTGRNGLCRIPFELHAAYIQFPYSYFLASKSHYKPPNSVFSMLLRGCLGFLLSLKGAENPEE